jgi:pyruvate ferredoxin oxidoreductase gamma subunit
MLQLRLHGRGGQGGKTAAEILAIAAINSGKFAKSFPEFGPERTGAPVQYYVKISDKEIKTNQPITKPDIVSILDNTLIGLVDFSHGLKTNGILLFNSDENGTKKIKENFPGTKTFIIDASGIAIELFQKNLPNVPMLGAIIKVTSALDLKVIEEEVKHKFAFLPPELLEKNLEGLKRGYNETKELN